MSTSRSIPSIKKRETHACDDLILNKNTPNKLDTKKILEQLKNLSKPQFSAFNLDIFEKKVRDLAWSGQTKALKKYFEENIPDLKIHVKSIMDIMRLLPYLNESTSFLIQELPRAWLKTLNGYKYLPYIAKCLNIFSAEHWNIFLDHTYGNSHWLTSRLTITYLKEMLKNMTGCADDIDKQCNTLLSYIGEDFLRNNFNNSRTLAELLNGQLNENCSSALLDVLDGKDHWINVTFNNPTNLNVILMGMMNAKQTIDEVINQWRIFLKHLSPNWQTNMLSQSTELDNLLSKLGTLEVGNHQHSNAEIFLRIIAGLGARPQSNNEITSQDVEPSSLKNSYQLMQLINEEQIHDILLNDKSFRKLLATTKYYHNQPFFKLALLAIAKAHHFELTNENPSLWAMFDYSPIEKIFALENLVNAILNNAEINEKIPGINKGRVGKISNLYRESYQATILHPKIKHVSLGKSQPFV
jgi:hypothetical protein